MKRCGNSEEVDNSQRALAARAPEAQEERSCAQMCARPSLLIRLRELAHLLVRIGLRELAYCLCVVSKGLIVQTCIFMMLVQFCHQLTGHLSLAALVKRSPCFSCRWSGRIRVLFFSFLQVHLF